MKRKGLKLVFTALAMFSLGLSACGTRTASSSSSVPQFSASDGHIFAWECYEYIDLGDFTGPAGAQGDKGDKGDKGDTGETGPKGDQGEQGIQGEQGPAGQDGANGQDGVNGQDGAPGADGQNGADGQDGVGIKDISRTDNDGVMDIYTITMTDDSTFTFKVPNAPTGITVAHNRVDGDGVDLPYYVGASAPLDITVTATFVDGSELEVSSFEVTGFDTTTAGKKDVVVKLGALSDAFSVDVVNISDEVADVLSAEGVTDVLPGLSSGAVDYQYVPSANVLLIALDEDADTDALIAQYGAELVAAGFAEAGADSYGDMHYTSPNNEFDVCAWNYYGYIRVDIKVYSAFPLDQVNNFLTTYGYPFTFDAAIGTAFGRNTWTAEADESSGYHYLAIYLEGGDYVEAWKAIINDVLVANDFEWDDTYGYVNYTTYKQISVYYNANYDVSIIQIWE